MKNLIQKAMLFAIKTHEGQVRKGDGVTPYVLHSLEVGIILSRYTTNEDMLAAAILHDVLEMSEIDKKELAEEFNEDIANAVSLLTEDESIENWASRKMRSLEKLKEYRSFYIIKVVDALVNMKDLLQAVDEQGEKVWDKFNASKELKLAYFAQILEDMRDYMPNELLEGYIYTMKDLQYSHLLEKKVDRIGFTAE